MVSPKKRYANMCCQGVFINIETKLPLEKIYTRTRYFEFVRTNKSRYAITTDTCEIPYCDEHLTTYNLFFLDMRYKRGKEVYEKIRNQQT